MNDQNSTESNLVITAFQVYSEEEMEMFFMDYVSHMNYKILLDHLTIESLAREIIGFTEQNGELLLFTQDGTISVRYNLDNPRFSN